MATYNPQIVSQLNKKRADAAASGTGAHSGVLKDYATFAASLGERIAPVAPVSPGKPVTPPITPSSAYANLILPTLSEDDAFDNSLFERRARSIKNEPNERDIYKQKLSMYQKEINATNQIYADMLQKAQTRGIGDFGSQRAVQARSGLLGSDFASSQNAGVADANAMREKLVQAERAAALGAIMGRVRSEAAQEIASKREAYEQGLAATRTWLAERATRRKNYATSWATSLLDQGIEYDQVDPNQIKEVAKLYGTSTADLLSAYREAKAAREEAARAQRFEEAKAEVRYNPETGKYESVATPEGFSLSEGQERYEYNPETGEMELVASVAPEPKDAPGKFAEYEYGVTNGYITDSYEDWMAKGGGSAELTNKQRDTFDKVNTALTGLREYKKLYDSLVTDRAGSQITGDAADRLRAAHAVLMFQVAAAAGTGALQAPDREIVEKMIPDPTNPFGVIGRAIRGGKSGALGSIDQAIKMYEEAGESIGQGQVGYGEGSGLISPNEVLESGYSADDLQRTSFNPVGNTSASTKTSPGRMSLAPTFNLIKKEEGLRTQAYQDQTGKWTIGFGNTMINGRPVRPGDKITPSQALALMQRSVINNYTTFKNKVRGITPNKFAALTSFEYNLGPGVWQQPTGKQILAAVNQKRYDIAGRLMRQFNKSRDPASGQLKVNPVLAKRRQREANLLLS